MQRVVDDRARELWFPAPPRRVVSLVPSDTYTVAMLAGVDRLVGRTDYCDAPSGVIEAIPSVGGSKSASVEKIRALEPDLVIANQEENNRATVEALAQAGVPVFLVFPKRVDAGVALVARLAQLLGVADRPDARALVRDCHRALTAARAERSKRRPLRVFCPIWASPLMTIHGSTFISDALDLAGAQNVFADRERRYPLAADIGDRIPVPPDELGGRDVRYPRITDAELVARAPDALVLPDEPHPFGDDDVARFRALPFAVPPVIRRVRGKDVCWYGAWSAQGIPRLGETIRSLADEVASARGAG